MYTADTDNLSHGKLVGQQQRNSTASCNGLTNRYHKTNGYCHDHTKFGFSSHPNKYVYVSSEKTAKSPVTKPPVQLKSNEIQNRPIKKFTRSRNDVFRFTSVPKQPVATTCNLVTKINSMSVKGSCKNTEAATVKATSNIKHKLKCVCHCLLVFCNLFHTVRKEITQLFHLEVNSSGLVKITLILLYDQQLLVLKQQLFILNYKYIIHP